MIEQEQIVEAANNPDTVDYFALMGTLHFGLAAIFYAVNTGLYPIVRATLDNAPPYVVPVLGVLALAANYGMQLKAYEDKDLTANLTTMGLRSFFKLKKKPLPMLIGFVTNTIGQTFGTPTNYLAVYEQLKNGEPTFMLGLLSQWLAGAITTSTITGLIYTDTLPPVLKWLHKGRMKVKNYMDERVERALTYIGEYDVLSRYDE